MSVNVAIATLEVAVKAMDVSLKKYRGVPNFGSAVVQAQKDKEALERSIALLRFLDGGSMP